MCSIFFKNEWLIVYVDRFNVHKIGQNDVLVSKGWSVHKIDLIFGFSVICLPYNFFLFIKNYKELEKNNI